MECPIYRSFLWLRPKCKLRNALIRLVRMPNGMDRRYDLRANGTTVCNAFAYLHADA